MWVSRKAGGQKELGQGQSKTCSKACCGNRFLVNTSITLKNTGIQREGGREREREREREKERERHRERDRKRDKEREQKDRQTDRGRERKQRLSTSHKLSISLNKRKRSVHNKQV